MRRHWIVTLVSVPLIGAIAGLGVAGSNPKSLAMAAEPTCSPAPAAPAATVRSRLITVSPRDSLQAVLDRAHPGDRILLRAGTYAGYFLLARDGTARDHIVVRSYPGEAAVIQGRLKIDASHVVVSNLVFDQSGGSIKDVAVFVDGGTDDWIVRNEIRHSSYSGILVGEGVARLSVVGNWIHDDGSSDRFDHGVYWAGGVGGLLAQNMIADNSGYGVQLYPDADGVVVRRNTIVGNGRSGIVIGGNATQTSDGNVVLDNVVVDNNEQGIRTSWDGPVGTGNVARDNVVFGNPVGSSGGKGLDVSSILDTSTLGLHGSELDTSCVVRGKAVGRR